MSCKVGSKKCIKLVFIICCNMVGMDKKSYWNNMWLRKNKFVGMSNIRGGCGYGLKMCMWYLILEVWKLIYWKVNDFS